MNEWMNDIFKDNWEETDNFSPFLPAIAFTMFFLGFEILELKSHDDVTFRVGNSGIIIKIEFSS